MAEPTEIIARIHYDGDIRYPTLVIESQRFGTIGYSLDRDTGDLERVCICSAWNANECVCGAWDIENDDIDYDD